MNDPAGEQRHAQDNARSEPPTNWRQILDELGVRPSKALGQNFLHERKIVRRIAETAALSRDDLVVEVGPGLGILTRELAERAGEVISVELDRRLAEYLREANLPDNVSVVESDILNIDPAQLTTGRSYSVVANLPYSVASAAITQLLEHPHRPRRLVVMVQREVAERIVSQPPNMSVLAVAVQIFGQPRIAFRIGPGAFIPPPKVDSAVLVIEVNEDIPIPQEELPAFFAIVRAGFGQRRKRLANSLAQGLNQRKPIIEQQLVGAGIDPDRRAETLSVDEWLRLHQTIQQAQASDV